MTDDIQDIGHDFKLAEGVKQFSSELLRLSLLAVTGCGAMWIKLRMPDPGPRPRIPWIWLEAAVVVFMVASALALLHLYVSNLSLTSELARRRTNVDSRLAGGASFFRLLPAVLIGACCMMLLGVVLLMVGIMKIEPPAAAKEPAPRSQASFRAPCCHRPISS